MLNTNISYMFNKIYLNLMKEIKDKDVDIKGKLKANYKVFDKKSSEYISKMVLNMDETVTRALFGEGDIMENLEILNFEIFIDVTVNDVLHKVVNNNESLGSFKYYIYVLMVLCYIYKMDDITDEQKEILLRKTVYIMNSVDTDGVKTEEEFDKYLDDILDDDLRKVLWKMYNDRKCVKESVLKLDSEDISGLEFLNNTKIGELAKEISSSIDMSKLNMENPEEMLSMKNLFSGSNNILGDIIQTVGTKITQKIQSGEINQEDLMGEALNMMGSLNSSGHGDMMSQMMGMMSGMGSMMEGMNMNGTTSGGENKTRDRLQKKLANKNNK
jgi:hypothetical protein